jgi:cob(I)alamin adenosyltransferase
MDTGLVHIYTGEGKGKTTAALGLAVRAKGAGLRVLVVQFLKGRDTGELASLKKLDIPVIRTEVKKFIPYMTAQEKEACQNEQETCLSRARKEAPGFDLVVLDEIFGALFMHMVTLEDVLALVKDRPRGTELVLTGRDAPAELLALADYVSDIRAVKHPYDAGVAARRGIEF